MYSATIKTVVVLSRHYLYDLEIKSWMLHRHENECKACSTHWRN